MNFIWNFQTIEVKKQEDSLSNVVVNVYWQYTAEDGIYREFLTGSTTLLPPDPDSFVDLTSVTQNDLETWVTAAEDVAPLRDKLIARIESKKASPTYVIPFSPVIPPPAPPLPLPDNNI